MAAKIATTLATKQTMKSTMMTMMMRLVSDCSRHEYYSRGCSLVLAVDVYSRSLTHTSVCPYCGCRVSVYKLPLLHSCLAIDQSRRTARSMPAMKPSSEPPESRCGHWTVLVSAIEVDSNPHHSSGGSIHGNMYENSE